MYLYYNIWSGGLLYLFLLIILISPFYQFIPFYFNSEVIGLAHDHAGKGGTYCAPILTITPI